MKPTIGIIGGKGQMGLFFDAIFQRHTDVLISDIETKFTNEQLVEESDIIIISVPIDKTIKVIESITPLLKEEQLVLDLTSTKTGPVEAMLKSKAGVVGLHPMFGPGVKTLEKQKIIICPERPNDHYVFLKKVLEKEKAEIKLSDPKTHDKMMSVIQGMKHFSSITMSYALSELGVDINESMEYTSPIYRLEMDMVGRILNQDPELYADIEFNINHEVLEKHIEVQQKMLEIIKSKDKKKFLEYFKKASDHLGSFKNQAESESNYLIQQLVNK